MKWEDYVIEAHKSAQYGGDKAYPVLGLVSEVSEFFETPNADEMGDVFWYIAELCTVFNVTIEDFEPKYEFSLAQTAAKLAGRYKKVIRGDTQVKDIESLIKEIYKIAVYICTEVYFLDLDYVLEQNINKLRGRMERGTIKGDGIR